MNPMDMLCVSYANVVHLPHATTFTKKTSDIREARDVARAPHAQAVNLRDHHTQNIKEQTSKLTAKG
jgi:hypothetical protein